MIRPRQLGYHCALALVLCAVAAGCAQLRLPAIDPTGERIFLPAPAATTFVHPVGLDTPQHLQPAWQSPPPPPLCPETAAPIALPVPIMPPCPKLPPPPPHRHPKHHFLGHHHHGGHHLLSHKHHAPRGHVTLNPMRVVAPVGGDVVLIGGFCGEDGNYLTHQPVRWILTGDSVGHFVEVGDDGHSHLHHLKQLRRHPAEMVTGNYAIGRTSSRRQVITRGTPSPMDDIHLAKGQTWVSVTSPVEGTSYVSLVAPEGAIWGQRRETATIHWIDAQWMFPPPAIAQAGASHTLTTQVTRSDGTPVGPGWLVRYEILGDSPAVFAEGATVVEVPVQAGVAAAELVSAPGQPGVSQVRIQVIRDIDGSPRMPVGEGFTSVTWSAPGLSISATGPEIGTVNSTLVYRAVVHNPGDVATPDVVVRLNLPAGLQLLSSSPTGQVFGDRVEWQLGTLQPRTQTEIAVNLRAELPQSFRLTFQAESAPLNVVATSSVDTQVYEPSLDVQMEGPETAEVGQRVQYRVRVRNTGQHPLVDVLVRDRFDPGLEHESGETQLIERSLGTIQPGEEVPFAVTFTVRQAGELCHTLEVIADGQRTSVRACLTAVHPRPREAEVTVRKTGPALRRVGEEALYAIEVINTGDIAVTNVQVIDVIDPALQPTHTSEGIDPEQFELGRMVWHLPRLDAGHQVVLHIRCICIAPSAAAINRVTVTADPGVSETAETATQIIPPEEPQVRDPDVTGQLVVTVADMVDPVAVGEPVTYRITITNDRDVLDRNVGVRVFIPDGMQLRRIRRAPTPVTDATAVHPRFSPDGRTAELPEVRAVRPGETLPAYDVELIPQAPGTYHFRVEVSSMRTDPPIEVVEETTVFAG